MSWKAPPRSRALGLVVVAPGRFVCNEASRVEQAISAIAHSIPLMLAEWAAELAAFRLARRVARSSSRWAALMQ
jgi:hypothetical protein